MVTWFGIHWDVHTVAEATTCAICVLNMQFKICRVMSRPLQLCTPEKLHFSNNDGGPHIPKEGYKKLSTMTSIMLSSDGYFVGRRVTSI